MTEPGLQPELARLERCLLERRGRREGREIRFLCPAHDDTHPSARWSNSKAVWYCDVCHEGGGWRDLCRRLGLEGSSGGGAAGLGGAGGTGGGGTGGGGRGRREHRREVVAAYAYTDPGGRLLYEVLRLRPKAFSCRRPDGAGGWLWNLQGVERVLYRLPEVAAAVLAGEIVFLVEGEKDADAIAALGFPATTHAGGAGKWRPEHALALRGARVVVVPDNDEPGRRHAEAVLAALRPHAALACRLELPGLAAKGDFSDWLAGRRAEGLPDVQIGCQLLDLAGEALSSERSAANRGAAPDRAAGAGTATATRGHSEAAGPAFIGQAGDPATVAWLPAATSHETDQAGGCAASRPVPASRVRCLAEIDPEPVRFLWSPYLPVGKLTLLEGDPGQGKSWLAAAIAAAGSRGSGLPGLPAFAPFRTLFLTAEDGLGDTLRPRIDSLGGDCAGIFVYDAPLALDLDAGLSTLGQQLAECGPQLLVVDPLVAFLGRATDIYRANEVRSVLAPLIKLTEKHRCALLAVRHLNKAKLGRTIYAGQGSIDFTAAARSVLLAGSAADEAAVHAVVHIKSNLAPHGPALGYRLLPAFSWQGPSCLTAGDLLAAAAPADETSAEDDARIFLRTTLGGPDPLPSRLVLNAARDAGISQRTLKRAKRKEGVRTTRRGFGAGSTWLWSLPEAQPQPGQAAGDGGHGGEEEVHGAERVHIQAWPPSANDGADPEPAEPSASFEDERRHAAAGGAGGPFSQAGTEAGPTGAELDDSVTATKKGLLL